MIDPLQSNTSGPVFSGKCVSGLFFLPRRISSIYCWHWSCLTSYIHVAVILHGVVSKHWSSFVSTAPVRTSASATSFKAQGCCMYHRLESAVVAVCTTLLKHSECCMYHSFKAQWLLCVPLLQSTVIALCTTPLKHSGCCMYHLL